jgi:hypothetical protein
VIRRASSAWALGLGFALGVALGGVGHSIADAALPAPTRAGPGIVGLLGANAAPDPRGDTGQDIRDIHGPIAIPRRRSGWWCFGGAGLAGGALAALVLYARRRKPVAPPHERALRALTAARAELEGDPRQLSFAASEIVRRYVEEAFQARAAHRTTEELLSDLMSDRSPLALHRAALGEFLHHCDLAKFAGWSLSPADRVALLDSAEAFVRATAAPGSPEQVRPAALRGGEIA